MYARLATLLIISLTCFDLIAQEATAPALPVGKYECKLDKGYKLRECEVIQRDGQTVLILPSTVQHLVSFEATVRPTSDKKAVYVSVSRLTDERPWGCYACDVRCLVQPQACACTENPPEATEQCRAQPLHFVLSAAGKDTWRGLMPYRVYSSRYKDGAAAGFDYEVYPLEVTIKRKK